MKLPVSQLRPQGPENLSNILRKPPPKPPTQGTQLTQDGTKVFPPHSDKDAFEPLDVQNSPLSHTFLSTQKSSSQGLTPYDLVEPPHRASPTHWFASYKRTHVNV